MSIVGRLRVGSPAELAALRTAIDDLGRAHHQTAHGLSELRAKVADMQRLFDPVGTHAVRDAVESMLALVSGAVADAQAAHEESRAAQREAALLRARVAELEQALDLLRARVPVGAAASVPARPVDD